MMMKTSTISQFLIEVGEFTFQIFASQPEPFTTHGTSSKNEIACQVRDG